MPIKTLHPADTENTLLLSIVETQETLPPVYTPLHTAGKHNTQHSASASQNSVPTGTYHHPTTSHSIRRTHYNNPQGNTLQTKNYHSSTHCTQKNMPHPTRSHDAATSTSTPQPSARRTTHSTQPQHTVPSKVTQYTAPQQIPNTTTLPLGTTHYTQSETLDTLHLASSHPYTQQSADRHNSLHPT